jgi:hypothetical protein|tara:strand:+ start:450 stop:662 length:213 start_codon:yes stop_codon:yes gene_type:complete
METKNNRYSKNIKKVKLQNKENVICIEHENFKESVTIQYLKNGLIDITFYRCENVQIHLNKKTKKKISRY